jgi:predicted nucleic acid-binding protein
MILLDTCVISEAILPKPSGSILAWIESLPEHRVYIPAMVLAELQKGVCSLPRGRKRDGLSLWVEHLSDRFEGRILAFDGSTGFHWARITCQLEAKGIVLPLMDSLLAALAIQHSATLATRNLGDFEPAGISLVNPWEYGS